ncbi:MAG: HD domain-containing protein [Blastocatellales bacterium]
MIYAAIDIGSNSIHHVVVEIGPKHQFRVLARDKEVVRLGRSVARDGKLSATAIKRAVECLKRYRQRAEKYGAEDVIAVATSAVREASNRHEFLTRAADDAGVHVELLSGTEEARLIALAASARYEQNLSRERLRNRRLLVIDIGGGSTELAIVQNGEPVTLISFKLGAVRLTEMFVNSDPPSEKQLRRLRAELRQVLKPRSREIIEAGFDDCYGTSGTINALGGMILRRHLAEMKGRRQAATDAAAEQSFRVDELREINRELSGMTIDERVKVPGLNKTRAEIIIAGGQLLEAIMEIMEVEQLSLCDWALREGILISRLIRHSGPITTSPAGLEKDPSLRGALLLAEHYNADMKHALRVAYLSQQMFDALLPLHLLGGEHRRLLSAAALLHDVGYLVSHTGHHKHSAYLIHHGELAGFMASEVAIIANLARYHRSSMPKAKHPYFAALGEDDRVIVRKLAAILRITDALDRDHQGNIQRIECELGEDKIILNAVCSKESDADLWRIDERSDLFREVYGRKIELKLKMNDE